MDVRRYIETKISLLEADKQAKNLDIKTKALLKRWHEFDNQYLEKWKKKFETTLEAIESCYC